MISNRFVPISSQKGIQYYFHRITAQFESSENLTAANCWLAFTRYWHNIKGVGN